MWCNTMQHASPSICYILWTSFKWQTEHYIICVLCKLLSSHVLIYTCSNNILCITHCYSLVAGDSNLTTPSTQPVSGDSGLTTVSAEQEPVKQALSQDDQSGMHHNTQNMYCVYVLYQYCFTLPSLFLPLRYTTGTNCPRWQAHDHSCC